MAETSRRELWDAQIETAAAAAVANDARLRGLPVDVRCRGGVLHLSGAVGSADELARVRATLGWLAGGYAVWDTVSVAGRRHRVVDLGCGASRQDPAAVGLDRLPLPGVGVIADVAAPLPLATASIDRVYAVHVLEHLDDLLGVLAECHRVLRPGGVLHVLSPDRAHVNAYADPTHVRYFDVQTFKYVCVPRLGVRCWYPLQVATDGASVFADLVPVRDGDEPADAGRLARFFD